MLFIVFLRFNAGKNIYYLIDSKRAGLRFA